MANDKIDNYDILDAGSVDLTTATKVVNGVHYPIRNLAIGDDASPIGDDNRMPVELPDLIYETDIVIQLQEISRKLSILIEYEAMLHKVDLEENL